MSTTPTQDTTFAVRFASLQSDWASTTGTLHASPGLKIGSLQFYHIFVDFDASIIS